MTPPAGIRLAGAVREELREKLRVIGFDEVRFTTVFSPNSSLRGWLDSGQHADMDWMDRTAEKRMHPEMVLEGVRSVILLGVNYWRGATPVELESKHAEAQWARYALYEDYHDSIKPGLAAVGKVLEQMGGVTRTAYRYYVDTGPVLERGWAARSGLGFRGKNAMLISRQHGNWLLLASILTQVEIEPDAPLRAELPRESTDEPAGLLCGKCTRCLDACPTQAFSQPGVVDARRCISYQTIENKGIIPRELRAGIGTRIYGCDLCLEVCPWNRFAQAGRQVLLVFRQGIVRLELAEILRLTPERFAEIFRRTPVKRLKLTGLLRNACVVAGNSRESALLPDLIRLAGHASPVVRAHAVWAVRQIAGSGSAKLLITARTAETDVGVLAEYETRP